MSSQALQAFLRSLDDASPSQDTYDLEHLRSVTPAERMVAEDSLLFRARRSHDRRAIMSLAALGVRRAVPVLQTIGTDAASPGATWANRALAALGADTADRLAQDAVTATSFVERFAAVHELAGVAAPEALRALLVNLDDPAATLRSEAYAALLETLGLTPLTRNAHTGQPEFNAPLERIHLLVSSALTTLARRGADEIRLIVAGLAAGKTADELDLVYRATEPPDFGDALAASMLDLAAAIPVERVRQASGHDRAWAEVFLAAQLAPGVSRQRVPAALADLELAWTLEPLLEARAATRDRDPWAAELDDAIARLRALDSD